MRYILAVDHGNGNVKTELEAFPCGYKEQETKPSDLLTNDILEFGGKFFSLSPNRASYKLDKTVSDDCWIFTLFALGKQIKAEVQKGVQDFDWNRDFEGFECDELVLAVGLPPAHFEKKKENFKQYFLDHGKDWVEFTYNGKPFRFKLAVVHVFPQAYAAVMIYRESWIKKYSKIYCIDIGDGTVDLLAIQQHGSLDREIIVSRELGMSRLREKIIDDVINDYNMTLESSVIEDILTPGKVVLAPDEIINRVKQETALWATKIVDQLHTKVPDFHFAPTIFLGGGSKLLRPFLEQTGMFGVTDFISDIHANAVGYLEIAKIFEEDR